MRDLEKFLVPESKIPWESAAAFFVATKEATITKVAEDPRVLEEEVAKARGKGLLSGVRSSAHQDVTHATRVKRTRGARAGKELGTLGGAAAGYLAGRKAGIAGKLGGTALGALIGRGAGKSIGEEIDRARTVKRYDKSKKAELEKRSSVSRVRELWKLAQGEAPTEAMEGAQGAVPSPGPVDVAGIEPEELGVVSGVERAGPRTQDTSGAPTPEDRAKAEALAQLEQDMMLDEAAQMNEAEHYRQAASEMQNQLEQATMALQQTQMQAQQAAQQAQMAQMQADQATAQLQQQSQQDAAEKEQLNAEALEAKQNIMQMRQAMQAYRENLQQLALQDPTAMAGPSPEEQGLSAAQELAAQNADKEVVDQAAEAEKAQQDAAEQAAQVDQAAAKEALKDEAQAQEKMSSAIPELLAKEAAPDWAIRAMGAAIGAAAGGGIQALSDRKGPSGMSAKERMLRAKLRQLNSKKNLSPIDLHMKTMTRALADTAKINRENPGSAAAMAALTGAVAGSTLAPSAVNIGRKLLRR